MSNPIMVVENLSKQYRIGAKEQRHKNFREALVDGLTAPIRNLKRLRKLTRFHDGDVPHVSHDEIIWALQGVSFNIQQGEIVGIIGRNGAGKSTLLKVLSRIVEPTRGDVKIYGRLSSLLEIGTGFHPELTGRENIFLNGAILGMRKREIERKFDEIVAFAEIEKFVDTPVKRYSSGMYVRLAFAVAAHLEPEILLIDEVLAVGDVGFQNKCLGKMGDIRKEGRTVVFVSHNMGAIKSLCNRCLLIAGGSLSMNGATESVVESYMALFEKDLKEIQSGSIKGDQGRGEDFTLHPKSNSRNVHINCGETMVMEFDIESPKPLTDMTVGISIVSTLGMPIVSMSSKVQNIQSKTGLSHLWSVYCDLGRLPLNAGQYFARIYVGTLGMDVARFDKAFAIQITEHDVFGWGNRLPGIEAWGHFYWAPRWDINPIDRRDESCLDCSVS